MQSASDDMWKAAKDILTPQQLKGLKQIQLQRPTFEALLDPEAAKPLKLTDDQKNRIRIIREEFWKKARALVKDRGQEEFQETLKKIRTLRLEFVDKGLSVLTADQRHVWQELAGDPFSESEK